MIRPMALFLISYDICSPRRLAKVHHLLRCHAISIQYSVFLGRFTRAGIAALQQTLEALINPHEDDVRIYPLPPGGWQRRLGRATFPAGILFTGLPAGFREGGLAANGQPQPPEPPPVAAPAPAAKGGRRRGILLIR